MIADSMDSCNSPNLSPKYDILEVISAGERDRRTKGAMSKLGRRKKFKEPVSQDIDKLVDVELSQYDHDSATAAATCIGPQSMQMSAESKVDESQTLNLTQSHGTYLPPLQLLPVSVHRHAYADVHKENVRPQVTGSSTQCAIQSDVVKRSKSWAKVLKANRRGSLSDRSSDSSYSGQIFWLRGVILRPSELTSSASL